MLPKIFRATVATALSLCLVAVGCDAEEPAEEEIPFGLGGKADGVCPAEAELCWNQEDSSIMRALLTAQSDAVLGDAPAHQVRTVVDMARALEHKLTPEEIAAIDALEPTVDALADDDIGAASAALAGLQAEALERVIGTYYVANLVPAGQALDNGGKFDESTAVEVAQSDAEAIPGLTEGMQQSLRMIRDSGAIGITLAQLYKMTGVLERDYELTNAINFGEFDAVTGNVIPRGISREQKVEQIIARYRSAAGWVGAGSGIVGLIPIAGVPISLGGEAIALFKLHVQMTFEIGAVYGWDVREGQNLNTMTSIVRTEGLLIELGDILISNAVVPIIAKKVASRFGVALSADLASKLARRSVTQLMHFFSRTAQEELAEAALKSGARGVGRQLLGYATLGLAVLVSAGLDYVATDHLGRHVRIVAKSWLHDLLMEGTSYLADQAPRDCAMRALAGLAWDDGTIDEREKNLFIAFLAKPFNLNEETWFHLDSAEKRRQATMLAAFPDNDSLEDAMECLQAEFEDTKPMHRISLLGHLHAMVQIDLNATPGQRAFYDEVRDGLDGSGWFDGEKIDKVQMDYIEDAIFATVNPNTVSVSEEFEKVTQSLVAADLLDFIAQPHAPTAADFECGFSGTGC